MDENPWLFLSAFVILMLFVMTLLYANSITNCIDPAKCPSIHGNFGVEPGVTGDVIRDKIFSVSNLEEASNKCLSDDNCSKFHYADKRMSYLYDNDSVYPADEGGIYTLQINRVNVN